ncbi:RNA-binding domain-containing protein [Plebeiibacterium marinum]|uniref:DNA binding domain-containing protein n=1 Tax=Plebeiibacterium marinum TaxID=2992111 RepID=A0AAE3SLC5_9BACT|nr:RNA-binding domain-containing protein [Plebeiobacterium marinum]MCW3807458.1 putative DNA binding domain-containing protein [Plebeiobacterium marinum]
MNSDQLKYIIAQGENEAVEFKSSFNKAAIETIVAFSNTKGGLVIIGVSDNMEVTGVNTNNESIQNWLNEIKQKTEPSIIPNKIEVGVDSKELVVLSIPEVPVKPVALQGRYYLRKGNSNHLLNADEIVELRMESMNLSFDAYPVKTKFKALNNAALKLFSTKTKEKGRYIPSPILENDFHKLGLIQNDTLTRACELLFGLHHTSIHIGRFKSSSTIIDDILIKSPLIQAVEEAMDFIKKNIRLGYEFTGDLSRKDKWQFPLQAIRELLLNAIIHKDYRNPTDVIIKIYDNEIQFSNPGNLFGNLTIDELNTDSYQPRHRNRLLAEVFYLMGEVEKYGTGFKEYAIGLKNTQILLIGSKT